MKGFAFRELVAVYLFVLFAWALYNAPHDAILQGAVLTAFAAAWGYYLGGSKVGSDTAAMNANTISDNAKAAVVNATADSGDPNNPQQVEVINTTDKPVPTEAQ